MEILTRVTPEIRAALDGVIPFSICTCDAEGVPNITFMSQLYYVDEQHLALSQQFLNKTWRNLLVNPVFTVMFTDPQSMGFLKITLEFLEERTEGPVFEEIEMQLLALATPQHINFSLQSALICKVISIENFYEGVTT